MLLGRTAERARIDALLAGCRSGLGGALVLEGEAGIGKTALLEYAADQATEMRVLRSRGIESESRLPFRGLWDLVRPILERLPRIPAAQAASLGQAFALASAEGHDRFSAFVASHSLLISATEKEPVLVICDDVQWLDGVSAEALLFTARRVALDPIAVLFGSRAGEDAHLDFAGIPAFTVSGLDRHTAGELLTACAGHALSPAVEEGLFRATAGNPLAMTEIVSLLSDAQLAGDEELPQPIPAGRTVATSLARTLRTQSEEARRALTVAAASDTGELRAILAALQGMDLTARDLQPLEEAGVITIRSEMLEFRHPLLRSAAYHLAPPQDRREAHRALAAAMTGRPDSASRAWHLAAGTIGPDESVAEILDAAAIDAQARGDPASASAAFEKAAALSPERADRVRRTTAAAAALTMAGRWRDAMRLLDRAVSETADPLQVAEIQSLRGLASMWTGRPREFHDRLLAEAQEVERIDPAGAASILSTATMICYTTGDIRQAVKTARLARKAQRRSGAKHPLSELIYRGALLLSGDAGQVRGPLIRMAGAMEDADFAGSGIKAALLAQLLVWLEQFDLARVTLRRLLTGAREAGAFGALAYPLTVSSELEFRRGAWPAAYVAAAEAVNLATELKQRNELPYSLVSLARIEAAMGLETECREHCAAGEALAVELGADSIVTYAGSVHGFNALGGNRPGDAVGHLAKLPDFVQSHGLGHPDTVQWRPDLIEAALLCGQRDLASQQLEILETEAERTGGRWATITSARCRGLLTRDDEFERYFNLALEGHPLLPAPFEDARTLLAFGRRLRREGRRSEARERLTGALALFEALGAGPWASSTRSELAATGLHAARRKRPSPQRLTAQEMQVALMVAEGATNKEAATRMFLSPRTIESHLRRVYSKLGLRSRTELVRWVAAEGQLSNHA